MRRIRRIPNGTELENLVKRGVRSKQEQERLLNFIGKDSGKTFRAAYEDAIVQLALGNPDHATLGSVYASAAYQEQGSLDRDYEDVYGTYDWTSLASDPDVALALSIVFGDRDFSNSLSSDLSAANELVTTRIEKAVPNWSSRLEQQKSLSFDQAGVERSRDEETIGIRGVEDDDAPIETIA